MATVQLVNVSKIYERERRAAVSDVSLDIADGEFVVLVGPSGCGKSTTLRMIAGLEAVSSGTIRIGDRVVNDVPPSQRDIAMVFQSYALYPHMTVRRNLGFALTLRKLPATAINARVHAAAATLELTALLDRKPRQLSGGQRQRVALGRAIVREPQVFLFDEPLSNLDAALRSQMRRELAALHRSLGATMVYVTHDQVEAMTLGQRIVVMKDGDVQQVGAPLALYERPANRFVAGFIGTPAMNFLDGVVDIPGGRFVLARGAGSIGLNGALARLTRGSDGAAVHVGGRAEHVSIQRANLGGDGVAAVVELVEVMGSETFVHARLGGRADALLVVVRCSAREAVALGDRVSLVFDSAFLHVFDAATGERMAHDQDAPRSGRA